MGRLNTLLNPIFIISIGLILRLYSIGFNPVVNVDGTLYLEQAKAIFEGRFHDMLSCYPYPTLYSFLVVPAYYMTGDWVLSGRLVSLISWLLGAYLAFKMAERFASKRIVSSITLLCFITVPTLVIYSYGVLRGPVAWTLVLLGMHLFFSAIEGKRPGVNLFLSSTAFLGAGWARPELFGFSAVAIAMLFFHVWRQGPKTWLILPFLAPILVAGAFLGTIFDVHVLLMSIKDHLSKMIDSYQSIRGGLVILSRQHPPYISTYFLDEARNLLWWSALGLLAKKTFDVFTVPGALLFVFGIKRAFQKTKPGTTLFHATIFLVTAMVILYMQGITTWALTKRHIILLLYTAIPFLALGVESFVSRGPLYRLFGGDRIPALLLCLLILLFTVPSDLKTQKRAEKHIFQEIGATIQRMEPKDPGPIGVAGYMKRLNLIYFYANLNKEGDTCFDPTLRLERDETPEKVLGRILYYIWDEKDGPKDLPMAPDKYGLTRVRRWHSKKSGEILLFKVNKRQ